MLRGCFASRGPGNLVRVHGIMDSMTYHYILISKYSLDCIMDAVFFLSGNFNLKKKKT